MSLLDALSPNPEGGRRQVPPPVPPTLDDLFDRATGETHIPAGSHTFTVTGLLQNQGELKAVVADVGMSPADLLARVAARLAGVPVTNVADKAFAPARRSG